MNILFLVIGLILIIALAITGGFAIRKFTKKPTKNGKEEKKETEGEKKQREKKIKTIYQIGGAVVAYILLFVVWHIANPPTMSMVSKTRIFWMFHVVFLVVNFGLLARIGMCIFFIRTVGIVTLIFLLGAMGFKIAAPKEYFALQSKIERNALINTVEEIKMNDKEQRVKLYKERLKELKEKSLKGVLTERELTELKQIELNGSEVYCPSPPPPPKLQPRQLSGIFRLPADGRVIDRDIDGKEIFYRKGERGDFEQITALGEYEIVNRKLSPLRIKKRTYTTAPAIFGKKIELRNIGGKEVVLEVKII